MGLSKRIFIENDPAYEDVRQAHRKEIENYLANYTERLSLQKFCRIEGNKRLDRTWEMAVFEAIEELQVDSATINRSEYFTSYEDRDAVRGLAEKLHPELFDKYGLKPPRRCPNCNGEMRIRLAKRGLSLIHI